MVFTSGPSCKWLFTSFWVLIIYADDKGLTQLFDQAIPLTMNIIPRHLERRLGKTWWICIHCHLHSFPLTHRVHPWGTNSDSHCQSTCHNMLSLKLVCYNSHNYHVGVNHRDLGKESIITKWWLHWSSVISYQLMSRSSYVHTHCLGTFSSSIFPYDQMLTHFQVFYPKSS
jgi:hypothetical protein